MVEITDYDSAKAWLETQDHQTRVWFASRCALRAVPALGLARDATRGRLAFVSFRAMLISGAAATCPAPEMSALEKAAAFSAHSAAVSAAHSADSAAVSAANSDAERTDDWPSPWPDLRIGDWPSLWPDLVTGREVPEFFADAWAEMRRFMADAPDIWGFWLEWYEAILRGAPLDWDLSFRIATDTELNNGGWEKGGDNWETSARHVAERIAEIRDAWNREKASRSPAEVSDDAARRAADQISRNREPIALFSASLIDQLEEFRETVRGLNSLPADYRDELLADIDKLRGLLSRLLETLPQAGAGVSLEEGRGFSLWAGEFQNELKKSVQKYTSPKNVADASVPTGIILTGMGLGGLIGGPGGAAAGGVIGGLIANQVKPKDAADQLTRPSGDEDAPDDG